MGNTTSSPTLIGPLTTTFTPPPGCATPFNWDFVSGHHQLEAYGSNCVGPRTCFPGTGTNPMTSVSQGYYSPGLLCPAGWEGATTIGPGHPELQSLLKPHESGAICCPGDFSYSAGFCVYHPESQDDRHYFTCKDHKSDTSLLTTFGDTSSIFMVATPIQLVWRPDDITTATPAPETVTSLSTTTTRRTHTTFVTVSGSTTASNTTKSTATSRPPSAPAFSPSANLIGAIVGGVIAALVLFGGIAILILKLRRRRKAAAAPARNDIATDYPSDTHPELPPETAPCISPQGRTRPPVSELPGSEIAEKDGSALVSPVSPAFELDGSRPLQSPR